jgi:hypothetical protein
VAVILLALSTEDKGAELFSSGGAVAVTASVGRMGLSRGLLSELVSEIKLSGQTPIEWFATGKGRTGVCSLVSS